MLANLKPSFKVISSDHFCPIIKGETVRFVCHIGFVCPEEAINWAEDEIIRSKTAGQLSEIWYPLKPTQYAQGH